MAPDGRSVEERGQQAEGMIGARCRFPAQKLRPVGTTEESAEHAGEPGCFVVLEE